MGIKEDDLQQIFDSLAPAERTRLRDGRILITGCGGFLGYGLMNFLVHRGAELGIRQVIGLDSFILGFPAWLSRLMEYAQGTQSGGVQLDIRRFDIARDALEDIEGAADANLIIHMASIASPTFYRAYPVETIEANVWGLRSLLDFYRDRGIRGLLFFSSSEVYGDPAPQCVPTPESYNGNVSCTGPRACYDESKRFGETMCLEYARQFHMPIGVVRPFNNYGPGMRLNDRRVVADFARAVMEGEDIVMLSDGTPTRTFCYIADAIAGYVKVLLCGRYDYFNIGIDAPEISIAELAHIYQEIGAQVLGYAGSVRLETSADTDYLTNNPQRRCPDISKARRVLKYDPQIDVHEGVRRYLTFLAEERARGIAW